MALLNYYKVIARTTEAKTKSKIISSSWKCKPVIMKLWEIFTFLTVHPGYHHTEYHPQYLVQKSEFFLVKKALDCQNIKLLGSVCFDWIYTVCASFIAEIIIKLKNMK